MLIDETCDRGFRAEISTPASVIARTKSWRSAQTYLESFRIRPLRPQTEERPAGGFQRFPRIDVSGFHERDLRVVTQLGRRFRHETHGRNCSFLKRRWNCSIVGSPWVWGISVRPVVELSLTVLSSVCEPSFRLERIKLVPARAELPRKATCRVTAAVRREYGERVVEHRLGLEDRSRSQKSLIVGTDFPVPDRREFTRQDPRFGLSRRTSSAG